MNTTFPRITFGIIVLNGEPFTRYCLRSLYPFAHEIIVVEGGHEGARAVCTPDGHSIDGTLETLYRFKREEDPENKVQIVTRDGFWQQTDEMGRHRTHQSRAYAERATGDYLWQIDIDEFYKPEDMSAVIGMLRADPSITAMTFKEYTFWGDIAYSTDGWILRRGLDRIHRLFKWGPGYRYITHEPPTVIDCDGRDLRSLHWIDAHEMERKDIRLYHYSLLFPWQVEQKVKVYKDEKPDMFARSIDWAENNYFQIVNPYRVHNIYDYPSWLERFRGEHPPEIVKMMNDVRSGRVSAKVRRTDDIEELISRWWYPAGRAGLKLLEPFGRFWEYAWPRAKNVPGKAARLLRRAAGGAAR